MDQNTLRAALLAAVPDDGAAIGNQSLLEKLRGHHPQLTEDACRAVRDTLIDEGLLAKGRGRGGAVRRASLSSAHTATASTAAPEFSESLPMTEHAAAPAELAKAAAETRAEKAAAKTEKAAAKADKATAHTEEGKLTYEVEEGVFKAICSDAAARVTVRNEANISLEGRRIWKMSLGNTLGEDAYVYDDCIANNYILLGYGDSVDYTGCSSREEILRRFQTVEPEAKPGDFTVDAVDRFLKMKKGDLVVVSDGNFKFRAIGEITGDYRSLGQESYGQCRDVKWLRVYTPSLSKGQLLNKQFSQATIYELKPGVVDPAKLEALLSDTTEAGERAVRPHVLIIDEINRGNVSRIFGELITLIEPSKRAGAAEALSVVLPYSKVSFSVPDNVYLIGTMNTADRSLAGLDIALRRRFVFQEMPPRPELLQGVWVEGIDIGQLLSVLNQRIEVLLDRDHCLGHAYFLPLKQEPTFVRLAALFRHQILPLLQEYFFEDWERIRWVLNDQEAPAGVVQIPCGTTLEILPKHTTDAGSAEDSRALLCRMLRSVLDLRSRETDEADLRLFRSPLHEWVMRQFLLALDHLTKRGIRFDYQRIEEEQRYLRGQLDVVKQMRQPPGREHRFQIRHDIFLPDRPENRLLRLALERVCKATQDPANWRLAQELRGLLQEIPASGNVAQDFRQWRHDRLMAHYQPVKPWCELVLGQHMPMAVSGQWRGISLLFPMEKLFEKYVEIWLRRHLAADARLRPQASSKNLCRHGQGEKFQLCPDLLVERGDDAWVLDTKWKRLDTNHEGGKYGLAEADVYQRYVQGDGELVLIYPQWARFQEPLLPFDFLAGGQRLWVLPFCLDVENEGLRLPRDSRLPLSLPTVDASGSAAA